MSSAIINTLEDCLCKQHRALSAFQTSLSLPLNPPMHSTSVNHSVYMSCTRKNHADYYTRIHANNYGNILSVR